MADSLVNHSYTSLAQGVSQQATEARHESQSEQMVNCIPHPSRGVMRRNPINFVTTLSNSVGAPVSPDKFFMYTYDRGTAGEQYVVLLGNRVWYVYDIAGNLKGSFEDDENKDTNLDYLECGTKHPKDVFAIVTVGDTTWISNNTKKTQMEPILDEDDADKDDEEKLDFHKTIAIYTVKSTGNIITSTSVSTSEDGTSSTQTPTIKGYEYHVSSTSRPASGATVIDTAIVQGGSAGNLLKGSQIAASIAYKLNNLRATVSTSTKTSLPQWRLQFPNRSRNFYVFNYNGTYAFVWNGTVVAQGQANSSVKVGIYTYSTSTLKGGATGRTYWAIKRSYTVQLRNNNLDGIWHAKGPVVYRKDMPAADILEYNDSFGNTAGFGFKGIVPSSEDLPATLPAELGNVLIKIDNSASEDGGEYWLKWEDERWSESRASGLQNNIDAGFMPHTLIRAENEKFLFGFYGEWDSVVDGEGANIRANSSSWSSRIAGDTTSAPEPSFIGKKISDLFVHNNRLGILAEDSIILSELSVFENFWPTTVRSIPATDSIDVVVATTDVTGLRKAVSLSGMLMLFSDQAQFALTGEGGPLTPETATVNALSNYNYNPTAPAKVLGNKVLFTTSTTGGTQLFSLATDSLGGSTANVVADNASLHIPTYLPKDIYYTATHSILGYMFMLSSDPAEAQSLYVLNTLEVGGQTAQSAFHKWEFDATILGISVLDNTLLMLVNYDGVLTGVTIDLDVPEDVGVVTYVDNFDGVTPTNYHSYVTLSKWFLKDANGYGNKRGRLQIRTAELSVGRNDSYKVELFNDSLINPVPTEEFWAMSEAVWNDTAYWGFNELDDDDTKVIWQDALPFFSRKYYNDDKITVASNSATTFIRFGENELEPTKGFTLSTVNLEGLFRQRSQRT